MKVAVDGMVEQHNSKKQHILNVRLAIAQLLARSYIRKFILILLLMFVFRRACDPGRSIRSLLLRLPVQH